LFCFVLFCFVLFLGQGRSELHQPPVDTPTSQLQQALIFPLQPHLSHTRATSLKWQRGVEAVTVGA
jgi:hypothetical protein